MLVAGVESVCSDCIVPIRFIMALHSDYTFQIGTTGGKSGRHRPVAYIGPIAAYIGLLICLYRADEFWHRPDGILALALYRADGGVTCMPILGR